MDVLSGTISVRPVLFCAPVFWTADFWSPATHRWDWVTPETPLDEKPSADFEISLDVTLEELFEAACDAWGVAAGEDLLRHGGTRAQQFVRFGFVHPGRDTHGVSAHEGYGWPSVLPIANVDGSIDQVPGRDVNYRQLLVASALGLVPGDVTRPYVHPVIPQGDAGRALDIARLTLDAIRAAYASVDDSIGYAEHTIRLVRASLPPARDAAETSIDEGLRIAAVLGFVRWIRRKVGRRER